MGSFHAETLARRLPGARLVAVADPAPGAAESWPADSGAARRTPTRRQLLADPAVDAVVIAAPGPVPHRSDRRGRRRRARRVFCEKPMALTLADADRAIAAAGRPG